MNQQKLITDNIIIDTADKSRDSMETIEDGANEVGEEISNEQTFSIQS